MTYYIKNGGKRILNHSPGRGSGIGIKAIIPGILVLMVFSCLGGIGDGIFAAVAKEHKVADLACQEPPHCEETGEVIGSPTPFYKDYFGENEEVWVAVDPKIIGHITKEIKARIYIVYNKTADQWNKNPELIDITGEKCGEQYLQEPEEITFQPGGSNTIFIRAWEKPAICEEGYDVVVDFEPFGEYNKGEDIIDGLEEKGFFVPELWVCLESISFNHEPDDDIIDGINLRMNALEEVHIPEWKKGEQSYPAAYIKNRAITVKAVFSSAKGVKKAKIRAVSKKGCLGNLVEETVFFSSKRIIEHTFTVTDCTPDRIKSFWQEWEWYIERINLKRQPSLNIATSRKKIFVLLARPQSPWKSKGQTEPWGDVLEETCKWARDAKYPKEAAKKITKHLHTSIGGSYETAPSNTYAGSSWKGFYFTNFFRNIKTGQSVGDVNCFDMSKALVTFANTVGCGLVYRESDLEGCKINCIKEIGKGWNCGQKLGPHGFGSIGRKIFDACFKLNNNCNYEDNYFKEKYAVNLDWDEYKKYLVRVCDPVYPKIYSFKIDGMDIEEIGFYLRERIDWGKNRYNFGKLEKDYRPFIPGELPVIKDFYCKKKKINLGEKTKVILKIKKTGDGELDYYWKISGGGIEKDCKDDLFYYASEPGKHIVTVTLKKSGKIIRSKYFKINILKKR